MQAYDVLVTIRSAVKTALKKTIVSTTSRVMVQFTD